MKTTYFIDSENVGDNWIYLLDAVADEDEILVFYTSRSPHMNYRNLIHLKQSPREVTFIECCEGNNALDFQLATDLGYRAGNISDGEFIIVTNDIGYDAIVKYWRKRNVQVKRIPGAQCAQISRYKTEAKKETVAETVPVPAVKAEPAANPALQVKTLTEVKRESNNQSETVSEEKTLVFDKSVPSRRTSPVRKPVQTKKDSSVKKPVSVNRPVPAENTDDNDKKSFQNTIDERAKEILYIIGKDDLQVLHMSLQQLYGAKKAQVYYNAFKGDNVYNTYIEKHEEMSLEEKQKRYCSIVFELSDTELNVPDDFAKFITDIWSKKKNLNSFRASLLGKYGKDYGNRYYQLIKAHIKIIFNIK